VRPIDDLLESFQLYYSHSGRPMLYNKVQRSTIEKSYSWIGRKYAGALADHVKSSHPISLRSLPDLAVIRKAAADLGNPDIYEEPPATPRITDDAGITESEMESNLARLREVVGLAASARRAPNQTPPRKCPQCGEATAVSGKRADCSHCGITWSLVSGQWSIESCKVGE